MRILGIDPGLQRTGWGVIEAKANQLSFVACGVFTTDAQAPMAERLKALHEQLSGVIEKYKPQTSAIEETFVNKNSASSLKLGQARGALMLTLALHGLPVSEFAANLVKKSVVGVGHAEKAQVQAMVKMLLPGCSSPRRGEVRRGASTAQSNSIGQECPPPGLPPMGGGELSADAADALAVAICAGNHTASSVIARKA